ncbi:MAG: AAA family ATPase, partial [Synergistaceae bacterium]|nr:AAA family ATPase [Synergistaceae bacterium]
VSKQAQNPSPVLRFDMSRLRQYSTGDELNEAIIKGLEDYVFLNDFEVKAEKKCSGTLLQVIYHLYKTHGQVVALIDEYDKPILDNINDLQRANEMREVLRSFYTTLKSCDEYLRFVLLTGISKFSKAGVFSALNNLADISMLKRYGDIVGYTQEELDKNFAEYLETSSQLMNLTQDELREKIKCYYDGFCFDGKIRLYNPFSMLNFFIDDKFGNYWYKSGSPTFIIKYMKDHAIQDPDEYRHIEVPDDFADSHEIERATPESFLYQSGYLTIEKWEGDVITLDYPNEEVRKSIVRMYLDEIYHVKRYITLGTQLWQALENGNIEATVELFNTALAAVPYDDFPKRDEFWYRSLFLMLLRGAGIISYAEVHTFRGRADLVIQFNDLVVVLEFKFAAKAVEKVKAEGLNQLKHREYSKSYNTEGHKVVEAVLVADDQERKIINDIRGISEN